MVHYTLNLNTICIWDYFVYWYQVLLKNCIIISSVDELFYFSNNKLILDEIRKEAWPLLLDITSYPDKPPTQEEIEAHSEYKQVVMDVNRSLKRFPPGNLITLSILIPKVTFVQFPRHSV